MRTNKIVKGVLGVSAVAALFAAFSVYAQNTGTQTAPAQSTPAAGQTSGGSTASLSRADRKLIVDMAMANMAEIESARMAQTKSQNEQIKNFAQQMIDDHTQALNEVKQLAQARGVAVPTELDRMHKAKADRMGALSGDAFDRAYMAQAGVAEHKKVHDRLRQAQSRAKDPEVKALVARALPIVDQHLNTAEQLHKSPQVGSSRTQGTTESSADKKTEKR